MTRVVSLFLPTWPTDRLRRKAGDAAPPAEAPLVLVGREGSRRIVLAADAAALTAGLRVGMPVAKAQVLVPGLVARDADPAADAEGLERLALWVLQRVAPIVAADPPDGIVIDSTGADHLHGGEQAMLDALVGRLTLSGVAARAAVADSRGAAHALARHAARPTFVAPPGHGASVLAPLPLEALRLPETMSSDLRVLGFERIGDLLAQPRAPLARRFGPELVRRIDQALGELAEPIEPVRPPDLDRGAPRLRRADRRRRDDRPLHRQAGGRASAPRSKREDSAPGASTSCASASTAASRPSASARRGRLPTPSA